jgi:hypothetical protein
MDLDIVESDGMCVRLPVGVHWIRDSLSGWMVAQHARCARTHGLEEAMLMGTFISLALLLLILIWEVRHAQRRMYGFPSYNWT